MKSKVFVLVLVAGLCSLANAGYVDTLTGMSGLISYWDLNETSGTTAADWKTDDSVDGNNPGAYSGTAYSVGDAGPRPSDGFPGFSSSNYAPTFNDGDGQLDMSSSGYTGTGGLYEITMLGWMKLNEPRGASYNMFGGLIREASSSRYAFTVCGYTSTGGVKGYCRIDGGAPAPGTGVFYGYDDDQAWHFIAMTLAWEDGDTLAVKRCYTDGALDDTDSASGTYATLAEAAYLAFGYDPGADRPLNGQLDELAMFDRALSGAEIETLWNAATIPEPATLMLLGLGGLACLRRRK